MDLSHTQFFKLEKDNGVSVGETLHLVHEALEEKGYSATNQIVGYIMSGDPTYITNHKNARSMIMKVERDELLEEMMDAYVRHKAWKDTKE